MTNWERKIIDEFISHYFASAPETGESRNVLRVRSAALFPHFLTAAPDEKLSYLEAAESLQQKGIINLNWEKHGEGEKLKTLTCENFEKLFKEAGCLFPQAEGEKIRLMLCEKIKELKASQEVSANADVKNILALLDFLSLHFSSREIGQGLDMETMCDFTLLLEAMLRPEQLENISTRALSILLYSDSKRLEELLTKIEPLALRAKKAIPIPDFSFLERSYPETLIAGKIFFTFKENDNQQVFHDDNAYILGFPLETVEKIDSVGCPNGKDLRYVLTIENKETFYALAHPQKCGTSELLSMFDCFLYVGGYSNRAAAAMIKKLAASGFTFYHAGDLDPDGILILQHIQELAGRPVTPLRMDAATFDQYRPWARKLTPAMLGQIKKIENETKAIPELAGLIQRIKETGLGVEQEIIDYRQGRGLF